MDTAQQASEHHGLVAALDRPTFATVTAALTEACRLGAFAYERITVQANDDPNGIWLSFSYGAQFDGDHQTEPNELVIGVETPDLERQIFEMKWVDDRPVEDVAADLRDRLRSAGLLQARNRPNWTTAMSNFRRSLSVALPRDDQNPWQLEGSLFELVGQDLAITTQGVAHRTLGMLLPAAEFPEAPFPLTMPGALQRPPWEPSVPDGVDLDEWAVAVDRAKRVLTRPNSALPRDMWHLPRRWVARGTGPNASSN